MASCTPVKLAIGMCLVLYSLFLTTTYSRISAAWQNEPAPPTFSLPPRQLSPCPQPGEKGLVLVVHYFSHNSSIEVDETLQKNIDNCYVEKILVTTTDEISERKLSTFRNARKLHHVPIDSRWSFQRYLDLADRVLPQGTTFMIANSDITYDQSLGYLIGFDMKGKAFSLASYHTTDLDYPNCSVDAQDTWILSTPVPARLLTNRTDFYLGCYGSDNRMAGELHAAGLRTTNPCKILKAYHTHMDRPRNKTPCYSNGEFFFPIPSDSLDSPENGTSKYYASAGYLLGEGFDISYLNFSWNMGADGFWNTVSVGLTVQPQLTTLFAFSLLIALFFPLSVNIVR